MANNEIIIKFDPGTKTDLREMLSKLEELIKRLDEVERRMAEIVLKEAEKRV